MPRKMLLTAALVISTAVFGQGQSTNQSTSPAPVNGPFGGPILVTPSASFPSPAPAAGISNAGQAGISNAGQAGISVETNSTAPVEAVAAPMGTTAAVTESNGALPTEPGNTAANDLMPSTSASSVSEAAAPGTVSLAEISSRYKAEKGTRNARVLGNDDVEKMLANKGGLTMAKNMPPLGPGALEQGGQPAGAQTAATPSGVQSASANQQATTPPVSSQGQSTAPDTSAENSTTPRVNQNQQSNDAQGSRRLPATAGFLPLLGLLGLASGGIGFWFRKYRK
ncbi:MAG TPA: hypothetical protein VGR76_20800 [Candidatus Angelobacter sp.]|jgi:hypothetical protein|nr:hypothetical protein [Candidatus Angelobacter sp.]